MTKQRSERAFALIAAIGVLVVLGFVVFAAANSSQFTFSFAELRSQDRRLSTGIQAAASYLAANPAVLSAKLKEGKAEPVLESGESDGKPVTVTVVPVTMPETLPFAKLDGDVAVRLEASFARGRLGPRTAVFLLNDKGSRPSPVALSESRAGGPAK